jgi:ABC-2 type transport system ATP-binding protein
VAGGTTVLLTTQYLDEADQLADQIVVMDGGRGIAEGTAEQLKAQIGGDRLDVVLARPTDLPAAAPLVAKVAGLDSGDEPETDADTGRISVPVADRVTVLTEALQELRSAGIEVADVGLRRPTLDDVFLRLTGHRAETEASPVTEADEQPTEGEAA